MVLAFNCETDAYNKYDYALPGKICIIEPLMIIIQITKRGLCRVVPPGTSVLGQVHVRVLPVLVRRPLFN